MATNLTPGDLAVVQYNSGSDAAADDDGFAFVLLKPVDASTVVHFTTSSFNSNNTVATFDYDITWTSPSQTLAAGTVVRIYDQTKTSPQDVSTASVGSISLSARNAPANNLNNPDNLGGLKTYGSRIVAYQGTAITGAGQTAGQLLFAFGVNHDGTGASGSADPAYDGATPYWNLSAPTNDSAYSRLPTALTNYQIAFDQRDNTTSSENYSFYYNGPLTGSESALLTAIKTPGNWAIRNNSNGGFTSYTGPTANTPTNTTPSFTVGTPPTTLVSTLTLSADNGPSSTDFITNTSAQTIGGTLNANLASGESVQVSVDGGATYTTATSTVGSSTFSLSGAMLLSGTHTLQARITNAIGSSTAKTQAYTLDTAAPTALSINRAGGSNPNNATNDSFTVSFSEGVTGVDSGDFTVAGSGVTGAIGSVTLVSNSVYTVTVNGVTGDGTLRLDLNGAGTGITDVAGNAISAGFTNGQTYTVDQTAPVQPGTPVLDAASDSGTSNSDRITSDTTPTITGTAEVNALVTLYDTNGTTVLGSQQLSGGATSYSITSSALSDATHSLTVKATDAAGNVGAASSPLAVTIDTLAPTVSSVTAPASGTYGTGQTLVITVNYSEPVTVAGTPQLPTTLDTGTVQATYTGGTGTSALTFAYTVQSGNTDANGIVVGSAISLNGGTITDVVGNNAVLALNNVGSGSGVLIDTTAPAVSSIVRATGAANPNNAATEVYTVTFAEAVTGVDDTDFALTSTATAAGTLAAGSAVAVNAVNGYAAVWTVTASGVTGDGTLRLDLNNSNTGITDRAANPISAGFTTGQTYTVDHTPPAQPAVPVLATASDRGPSSSDGITNATTPTLTGTADVGSTVTLYDTGGTTSLGSAVATNGNYSIASSALSAGAHTLTVTATDALGNVSLASSSLGIAIDPTAPVLGTAIVNGNTLTLTYTETGSGLYAGQNIAAPSANDYAVTVGNAANVVTGVAVDAAAKTVTLTLTNAVATSEVVTLSYTAGIDPGALTDIAGNLAANLTSQAVINSTPAPSSGGGGSSTTATSSPDQLVGTPGDDTIAGLAGDDTITAGDGSDLLYGNQDNDTVDAGAGDNTVYGGFGDDNVTAGAGSDLLFGNEGADTINAGEGNNTIVGGQDSTDGADLITSGGGNDLVFGNGGNDVITAGGGNDTLVAGFGDDVVLGNQGNDFIYGNEGNDLVVGGMGDDTLIGGKGDDILYGSEGNDVLFGNEGADRLVFGTNSGVDSVNGFSSGEGDRLDLLGQTYTVTQDAQGAAVLTLSGGGVITLTGIAASQVNAGFFA